MKKILSIAACLVLAALPLRAQLTADAGYMHAFEKAVIPSLLNSYNTYDTPMDGVYAGAKYNISLASLVPGLSVAPGANVSALFGKYFNDSNIKAQELAVNMPLHVMYTLPVVSDMSVQFMAGPTFQLGIYNKGVDNSSNPTHTYDFYKSSTIGPITLVPARNAFNVYMSVGAGVEVATRFLVNVGFDFGLMNMSSGENWKISRNVLKVGLGYIF